MVNNDGGSALHAVLLGLLFLALASADEEQIQLAQPDFAIYHTKYVNNPHSAPNPRGRPSCLKTL